MERDVRANLFRNESCLLFGFLKVEGMKRLDKLNVFCFLQNKRLPTRTRTHSSIPATRPQDFVQHGKRRNDPFETQVRNIKNEQRQFSFPLFRISMKLVSGVFNCSHLELADGWSRPSAPAPSIRLSLASGALRERESRSP